MTRTSTGNRTVYSASNAVAAIARALSEIKHEDGLTDADLGAVLGKSEDQAAKYRTGLSTMDAVTFGRGKQHWNGRFTGYFDRLCEDSRPGKNCDHTGQSSILAAALALSVALEDGEIDRDEVLANRATLENARDAIAAQLAKLRPAEARA
jgi:hypothetical protein